MHLPSNPSYFSRLSPYARWGEQVCVWYLVALDSVFLRACLLLCSHMSYLTVPLGVCPAARRGGPVWSEQAMHGERRHGLIAATRANVRSMRCASSEKCAGRHVCGVGMGYVGVSREDVAAAIMRRHAGREGGNSCAHHRATHAPWRPYCSLHTRGDIS